MAGPDFQPPPFPDTFVIEDVCKVVDDRLCFEGGPVTGLVIIRDRSDWEFGRIESFVDGESVGPWVDDILGLNVTRCKIMGIHQILKESDICVQTNGVGRVEGFWAERDGLPGLRFGPDGLLECLDSQSLVTSALDITARASWRWERGNQSPSSVGVHLWRDQRSRLASIGLGIDNGRVCRLEMDGPYWRAVEEFGITSDRWIPRTVEELRGFDVASGLKLVCGDATAEAMQSWAPEWLAPVETLDLRLRQRFDVDFVADLVRHVPEVHVQVPSLASRPDKVPEHGEGALVVFAKQLLRLPQVRSVSFSTSLKMVTIGDAQALPMDYIGPEVLVMDDEVRELIAVETVLLTPAEVDLIASSTKLEYVHHKSSYSEVPERLLEAAQLKPEALVYHRWKPVDGKAPLPRPPEEPLPEGRYRNPDVYPLFNVWLEQRKV